MAIWKNLSMMSLITAMLLVVSGCDPVVSSKMLGRRQGPSTQSCTYTGICQTYSPDYNGDYHLRLGLSTSCSGTQPTIAEFTDFEDLHESDATSFRTVERTIQVTGSCH